MQLVTKLHFKNNTGSFSVTAPSAATGLCKADILKQRDVKHHPLKMLPVSDSITSLCQNFKVTEIFLYAYIYFITF
jgi:hypothetical protein